MVKRKQKYPARHYTYVRSVVIETPKKQYVTLVPTKYTTSPLVRRFGIGYVGLLTPDVFREPLRRYVD